MGKRFKAASGRSALSLESLEKRQLLATIVSGSGSEVGSNIVGANGNTFDQILLTGASVTVKADPNQIVRISFLDLTGDIVQTEFAGSGSITVSLEDLRTVGSAGYVNNNPDQFIGGEKVNYVQGLASVSIADSKVDTNVSIFSAGIVTNPGLFTGQVKQGGNNIADVARLIISGDPLNPAGFTNFGGIRAGNATFSASSGVVGIRAENIAVQNIVAIGDIDATGTGVPNLIFNQNSQFQTVFIRGGDLFQTNGNKLFYVDPRSGSPLANTLGGFEFFNSTDGTTSRGTFLPALALEQNFVHGMVVPALTVSGDWFFDWRNIQAVEVVQNGTNLSALYGGDWLAKGGIQASLDFAFDRKAFTGDIVIIGEVPSGVELSVASAKTVSLYGNVSGRIAADGIGAKIDALTINGNLDGAVLVRGLDWSSGSPESDKKLNVLGGLTVTGRTGALSDIRAESIGAVTIMNGFSGILSTNVNAPNGSTTDNTWNGTPGAAGAGFVEYEGAIGNVSIGYDHNGANTGGSISNGTIQGMAGIGEIKVGGDIWASAIGTGVFVTSSNPGAAATDAKNFGSANIGTIDVHGDVALFSTTQRLIHIAGNGNYGNITVRGEGVTNTVPDVKTGSHVEIVPGSDALLRILSPFLDGSVKADASKGQKLVTNYDPDGPLRPLASTYLVSAADVASGAQIYSINANGTVGPLVAAKVGDRVPLVSEGAVVRDGQGNVVYTTNTALFQSQLRTVDDFAFTVSKLVSGNRGNLEGAFNNFGRIEVSGALGANGATTGTLTWTDGADQNFGGVVLNASGSAGTGATGAVATIGPIAIGNAAGAKSNLVFSGVIGSPNPGAGGGTALASVGVSGLVVTGFEDVLFSQLSATLSENHVIHATEIRNGVSISTVPGAFVGPNGSVSPSVNFESGFLLESGAVQAGAKALLAVDAGALNSAVGFNSTAGIVVRGSTPAGSTIAPLTLAGDHVNFAGTLNARTLDAISLTAGKGVGVSPSVAVSFTGTFVADTWAGLTISATEGDVRFEPGALTAHTAGLAKVSVGPIAISTAGTRSGGDIVFGGQAGGKYAADFGDISLTAGHQFFLLPSGGIAEDQGDIAINFSTTQFGRIANLTATTTTGKITDSLFIQGSAGNIAYKVGAAALEGSENYFGSPGNVLRAGTITANQTIWGNRGATTFETFGQKADGTAQTIEYTVRGTSYTVLPAGYVFATLNYAGSSTAAGDAFTARTGSGGVLVNYNIGSNDDNLDGAIALSEVGTGGSANVRSVSGDIQFNAGTQLSGVASLLTFGNLTLASGTFPQASGVITNTEKGDIGLAFVDLPGEPFTGGFDGAVGNITVTTTAGGILFSQTRFNSIVGNITLTAGAVTHPGGTTIGNISSSGSGVTFGAAHGFVTTTVAPGGIIDAKFTSTFGSVLPDGHEIATAEDPPFAAGLYPNSGDSEEWDVIGPVGNGFTGDIHSVVDVVVV